MIPITASSPFFYDNPILPRLLLSFEVMPSSLDLSCSSFCSVSILVAFSESDISELNSSPGWLPKASKSLVLKVPPWEL